MEELNKQRKKVVTPITTKDGRTFWRTLGSAYVNRDNSINVYLDATPVNGKLQVRDLDERDAQPRGQLEVPLPPVGLRAVGGGDASPKDDLPF